MPHAVVRLGSAPEELSAAEELDRGMSHMIAGSDVLLNRFNPNVDAIILGTTDALHRARLTKQVKSFHEKSLPIEGFRLQHLRNGARQWWIIQGGSPRAELYGAFRFLSLVAQDRQLPEELIDSPASSIRWVEQWDNLDGFVERGYAGQSIFFEDGHVRSDLRRVSDYGRLLSSVGINGLALHGDPRLLTPALFPDLARIAEQLRPWGIRLALSVNLSSPGTIGDLPTGDAPDPQVIAWWQNKVDEIYRAIPDLAGFTIDTNSEAPLNATPFTRNPADLASAFARSLAKHSGLVLIRISASSDPAPKTDLAHAAHDDTVPPLDGKFPPSVIPIINSPTGFQLREPVPPLTAAFCHTPQATELQITQEYTGQQRHMVYLAPLWKSLLDTDLRVDNQQSFARDLITGKLFHLPQGGFLGIANVGMDTNWLHHPMAMANLYSFGRLAWNPGLAAQTIVDEWTRMTWSNDGRVYGPIEQMNLASAQAYEQYTAPLSLGDLTDPDTHFGPSPESSPETNNEVTSLRATSPKAIAHPQPVSPKPPAIGTDRTVATGTGFTGQYPFQLAATYESLTTCPDNLLLFFHRVPYTHKLRGDANLGDDPADQNKTVIQHIYDTHYAGAAAAQNFLDQWETLRTLVDENRFTQVHDLLNFQAHHAEVWRDAIHVWSAHQSGIPDALGYVGHHPGREEAEAMQSTGFHTIDISPTTASAGKAVVCETKQCTLQTNFRGEANPYRIEIGYFDLHPGEAKYRLLVNSIEVARWTANDMLPPGCPDPRLNGNTATRFTAEGIRLNPGDTIMLEATPGADDPAAVDFLEITRDPRWN